MWMLLCVDRVWRKSDVFAVGDGGLSCMVFFSRFFIWEHHTHNFMDGCFVWCLQWKVKCCNFLSKFFWEGICVECGNALR